MNERRDGEPAEAWFRRLAQSGASEAEMQAARDVMDRAVADAGFSTSIPQRAEGRRPLSEHAELLGGIPVGRGRSVRLGPIVAAEPSAEDGSAMVAVGWARGPGREAIRGSDADLTSLDRFVGFSLGATVMRIRWLLRTGATRLRGAQESALVQVAEQAVETAAVWGPERVADADWHRAIGKAERALAELSDAAELFRAAGTGAAGLHDRAARIRALCEDLAGEMRASRDLLRSYVGADDRVPARIPEHILAVLVDGPPDPLRPPGEGGYPEGLRAAMEQRLHAAGFTWAQVAWIVASPETFGSDWPAPRQATKAARKAGDAARQRVKRFAQR